jgi:hypothetical protein
MLFERNSARQMSGQRGRHLAILHEHEHADMRMDTQVIHQQTKIKMYILHDWGVILQCIKSHL